MSQNKLDKECEGWEKWALGKLLTKERIHKESMYSFLRSLWYTKEWVNFVEVEESTFLVRFGSLEDRDRILSLAPWFIDQHILSLLPYVKDQETQSYKFELVPF